MVSVVKKSIVRVLVLGGSFPEGPHPPSLASRVAEFGVGGDDDAARASGKSQPSSGARQHLLASFLVQEKPAMLPILDLKISDMKCVCLWKVALPRTFST